MSLYNSSSSWGSISKFFHWGIALLIFIAIILGWIAETREFSVVKINLFIWHESVGITVLFLTVLRFIWKCISQKPGFSQGISETNARLADLGHWGLYGLMFALPVSGWAVISTANIPFSWFWIFQVPLIAEPNEVLQHQSALVHLILFWLFAVILVGHIGMAVLHHVKHQNDVLARMLPRRTVPTLVYAGFGIGILTLVITFTSLIESKIEIKGATNTATVVKSRTDTD